MSNMHKHNTHTHTPVSTGFAKSSGRDSASLSGCFLGETLLLLSLEASEEEDGDRARFSRLPDFFFECLLTAETKT